MSKPVASNPTLPANDQHSSTEVFDMAEQQGFLTKEKIEATTHLKEALNSGFQNFIDDMADLLGKLINCFYQSNNYFVYSRRLSVFYERCLGASEIELIGLFRFLAPEFWAKKGCLPVGSVVTTGEGVTGKIHSYEKTVEGILYATIELGDGQFHKIPTTTINGY